LVERFHGKEEVTGSSPVLGSFFKKGGIIMAHHNKSNLPANKFSKARRKRNSRHPRAITEHHIVPTSRGGSDKKFNLSRIVEYHHQKHHELFGNMTPYEILAWLETYFWRNKKWIDVYSFDRENILSQSSICPKAIAEKHVIPKSKQENKFSIHRAVIKYHYLKYYEIFGGMNPYEILAWLEIYFWKNQKKWIDNFSSNRDEILSLKSD
jgi:hypothetical protein